MSREIGFVIRQLVDIFVVSKNGKKKCFQKCYIKNKYLLIHAVDMAFPQCYVLFNLLGGVKCFIVWFMIEFALCWVWQRFMFHVDLHLLYFEAIHILIKITLKHSSLLLIYVYVWRCTKTRWWLLFITFWPGYECIHYFSQLLTFAPQHRTYLNHVTGLRPQLSRHSEGTPPEVPAVILIGPLRRQTRASFCNESRDLPRRTKWMNNSIFRL